MTKKRKVKIHTPQAGIYHAPSGIYHPHCGWFDVPLIGRVKPTDFSNLDLEKAWFQGGKIQNCDFRNSNLRGADFGFCNLISSDFRGADLEGANFGFAYLSHADFRGALNLEKADFTQAQAMQFARGLENIR